MSRTARWYVRSTPDRQKAMIEWESRRARWYVRSTPDRQKAMIEWE